MWDKDSMYAVNETRLVEELPLDVKDTSSLVTDRVERRNAKVQRVGVLAARAGVLNGGSDLLVVGRVDDEDLLAAEGRVHAVNLNSDEWGAVRVPGNMVYAREYQRVSCLEV